MEKSAVVHFHGFVLDAGQRLLIRGGRPVHLTRKAFDMLAILIGQAPRVVAKDELHRLLWPDTFVTDATVASVVKELRRALGGDDGGEPLLRTAHGVGYAFTGAIQAGGQAGVEPPRCWLLWGGRQLRLGDGPHDIGRDPRAAVWLDSPLVSRRHARIVVAADTATIEDLGSKNRTRVNGQPIADPVRLLDGDTIHIGAVSFLFRIMDVGATTETGIIYEPG